ncbi:hypothetical protein [Roseinatronobacter alkalisoli]|uniref:Uncharacterized protein n=1 Tax=Roseinatronobacter alkalisoli TaxID=3028235 RepID=A0ABT5TE43_9RHOB|nr:hypothetical protein [Roseinatronobacter sp. HJB301]MDD7972980.1 hypothetical protein [Roseinatronobacter sp. HJB301]
MPEIFATEPIAFFYDLLSSRARCIKKSAKYAIKSGTKETTNPSKSDDTGDIKPNKLRLRGWVSNRTYEMNPKSSLLINENNRIVKIDSTNFTRYNTKIETIADPKKNIKTVFISGLMLSVDRGSPITTAVNKNSAYKNIATPKK